MWIRSDPFNSKARGSHERVCCLPRNHSCGRCLLTILLKTAGFTGKRKKKPSAICSFIGISLSGRVFHWLTYCVNSSVVMNLGVCVFNAECNLYISRCVKYRSDADGAVTWHALTRKCRQYGWVHYLNFIIGVYAGAPNHEVLTSKHWTISRSNGQCPL